MGIVDPEKLKLADGTSVADRMRSLADALIAHNRHGIFILIDEDGNCAITGHIPDSDEELKRILHEAANNVGKERKLVARVQ